MAPPKLAITDIDGALPVRSSEGSGRDLPRGRQRRWPKAYLVTAYGQQRASDAGEEITVASGETRDRLVITMTQPGAIAGRLFDENGDPVEGVVLRALQVRYIDGRRRLVDMARFAQPTDDLGRFRLFGLEPGEYLVSAAVGQIDMQTPLVDLPGYGTTYFPGTPNPAEAQRVVVGRSQDVSGIDFPIARIRTARVSGRAVDSNGEPITGGIALTPSRRSGAMVTMQMGARIERGWLVRISQRVARRVRPAGITAPVGGMERGRVVHAVRHGQRCRRGGSGGPDVNRVDARRPRRRRRRRRVHGRDS